MAQLQRSGFDSSYLSADADGNILDFEHYKEIDVVLDITNISGGPTSFTIRIYHRPESSDGSWIEVSTSEWAAIGHSVVGTEHGYITQFSRYIKATATIVGGTNPSISFRLTFTGKE